MAIRGGQNFSSCWDQQMNEVNRNSIRYEASRCHRNGRREYLKDNKVGYKEVKNTTSFGMSKVVL
jgi:hypothetical protein